eukprot:1216252-Amorphochlora_amoeboformis.AAC.1
MLLRSGLRLGYQGSGCVCKRKREVNRIFVSCLLLASPEVILRHLRAIRSNLSGTQQALGKGAIDAVNLLDPCFYFCCKVMIMVTVEIWAK